MSKRLSTRAGQIALVAAAASVFFAGASPAARSAPVSSFCVGGKPGCFASVQAAVNAAGDGDTIQIGPGTFAGGITIDKSVSLVGINAAATIIKGGGPVITVGDGSGRPTVSISRVTITGGVSHSNPGGDTVIAEGGGVLIPPLSPPSNTTGATVSISDSVIAGNRATPTSVNDSEGPPCGLGCAIAQGAGIDNSGMLTLTDTRISDNVAGATPDMASLATSAFGAGIDNHPQGALTLRRSSVTGNRAAVTQPNSRFSEGAGVLDGGAMTMEDSVVEDNASVVVTSVASSVPFDVEESADAGGVDLSLGATATISRSTISRNTVSDFDSNGDAQALNGGIDDDGTLLLTDSRVDRNSVAAAVPPASSLLAGAFSGGLGLSHAAIVRSSLVSGNSVTAVAGAGPANAGGAGIGNFSGQLTVARTSVIGNRGAASGIGGVVVGGGILNIAFGGDPPRLSLVDSEVTANRLTATGADFGPHGGGIFSSDVLSPDPLDPKNFFPVTLSHTVVAGNEPDQCVGGC